MGASDIIGPVAIELNEIKVKFPNLPIYGYVEGEIAQLGVDAATIYG